MTHQWKQGAVWAAAVAVALMGTTGTVLATEHEEQEEQEEAFCPGSQGGYKNSDTWPVDNMTLGSDEYDEESLRALLEAPARGDASIILARQLIAAELNAADGHNMSVSVDESNTTAAETVRSAHSLIGDAELPAKVRGASGEEWTAVAAVLDDFNNGLFTEGCFEEEEEETVEETTEETTEEATREAA